jgi:hypothetical protein
MLNQAEQRIGFIHSFLEDPEGLSEDDWRIWLPLITKACSQVINDDFRKKSFEAIRFFNFHFYKKKQQQL